MKLIRITKSIAFLKIFGAKFLQVDFVYLFATTYFWTIYAAGSSNAMFNFDHIFVVRCEAKCWNMVSDQPQCMKNCLSNTWSKPGTCPSNGTHSSQNMSVCTHFCQSDEQCSGMLKCCLLLHCGDSSCYIPTNLHEETGLPPIPSNLIVHVNKENYETEGVRVELQWSVVDQKHQNEQILYIVEERNHVNTHFSEELNNWKVYGRTNENAINVNNIKKPGRWFQFRVTAVNENGTLGSSEPTKAIFTFKKPKIPNAPQDVHVSAVSWAAGHFHAQLTWKKPVSDIPVRKYKITWSELKNSTLEQHSHNLPAERTIFWFYKMTPNTEYFVRVQAITYFGSKRLRGKKASIVFNSSNYTPLCKHERAKRKKDEDTKRKHRIKNLSIKRTFWWQNELFVQICWKPAATQSNVNYFVIWKNTEASDDKNERYWGQTDVPQFELFGLQPNCSYQVQVKTTWNRMPYSAKILLSTLNCHKNHISNENIITDC